MGAPMDWFLRQVDGMTVDELMQHSKRVLAETVRAQAAQVVLLHREQALLELKVARLLAYCAGIDALSYEHSLAWKSDVVHDIPTAVVRRYLEEGE